MKYSLNWLKNLVGFSWPLPILSEKLADLGFPVESVSKTGVSVSGVVSAKILMVEKHPNADRLSVTQVDDGSGAQTVVCGATNIAVGQVVPLAKPGAVLPDGTVIAVARIRGVESHGMLCSERELGLSQAHAGILQLDPSSTLGVSIEKILGSDTILDLDVPPNRPDVLSHAGLAREISAAFGKQVRTPVAKWKSQTQGPTCPIEIKDTIRCSRYIGKILRNVKVGPSPEWLAQRLDACGIRPINNVVDITNYVLLEWGHPLHAFDLAKLKGPKIVVRRANANEQIEALDGKIYKLSAEDLVIADADKPVAIAGIMGGEETGVTETTSDILLESAVFEPTSIHRSSRRLGLKSESSLRFEKGTDFETAELASLRAASLLHDLTGAEPGRSQDVYRKTPLVKKLHLDLSRLNRLVGSTYKKGIVQTVLKKLNYGLSPKKDGWMLTIPSYRRDIASEADVAEDVLRSLGYSSIPSSPLTVTVGTPASSGELYPFHEGLRSLLKGWNVSEVLTSSLVNAEFMKKFEVAAEELVVLANPLSQEESALRPLLLPKLLESAQRNLNNQRSSIQIFEIGQRHRGIAGQIAEEESLALVLVGESEASWSQKPQPFDFYSLKGFLEGLYDYFGVRAEFLYGKGPTFLHPQQRFQISVNGKVAGWGGLLHPAFAKELDLPESSAVVEIATPVSPTTRATFRSFARQPFVERDLAVVLERETTWATVAEEVKKAGGTILKSVTPFDVFTGGNLEATKKSLAFRLRLQAEDRTLSDADINSVIERVKSALSERCGAQLR